MNPSEQTYQFYKVLSEIAGNEEFLSQNCFVQLTEPQQWEQFNTVIGNVFTLPEQPEI